MSVQLNLNVINAFSFSQIREHHKDMYRWRNAIFYSLADIIRRCSDFRHRNYADSHGKIQLDAIHFYIYSFGRPTALNSQSIVSVFVVVQSYNYLERVSSADNGRTTSIIGPPCSQAGEFHHLLVIFAQPTTFGRDRLDA